MPSAFTIAVNFDDRIETPRVAKLSQSADLRQHLWQEFLAAKSGIDGHYKDDIAEVEDVFDQLRRACRIKHHARLLAEVVDSRKDTVKMIRRAWLGLDEEMISTRFGEVGKIALRLDDHQVNIDRLVRAAPYRFDDYRPDRDVRHEATIHHINMDPIRTRRIDGVNLLVETSKVRRQD